MATFRYHRGSLEDSLKTAVEVVNLSELISLVGCEVTVKYYGFDNRINERIWIVSSKDGVVGMLNASLPNA